jgi:transposase
VLAEHAPDASVVACHQFSGFKTAAATLDQAVVVADVFHLVRVALLGLDEVRRQHQIHGHRGHMHDPLYKLRRVLRVGQERLTSLCRPSSRSTTGSNRRTPRTRSVLPGTPWTCSAGCAAKDRDTAHLCSVVTRYEWVTTVDVAEVTRLATTIATWQDQVLAILRHPSLERPPPRART